MKNGLVFGTFAIFVTVALYLFLSFTLTRKQIYISEHDVVNCILLTFPKSFWMRESATDTY